MYNHTPVVLYTHYIAALSTIGIPTRVVGCLRVGDCVLERDNFDNFLT